VATVDGSGCNTGHILKEDKREVSESQDREWLQRLHLLLTPGFNIAEGFVIDVPGKLRAHL
jgi:hypothetical protein